MIVFLLKLLLQYFNSLLKLSLAINNVHKLRCQMLDILASILTLSLSFCLKFIKSTLFDMLCFIVSALSILFGNPLECVLSLIDQAHNFQYFATFINSSLDGFGVIAAIFIQ